MAPLAAVQEEKGRDGWHRAPLFIARPRLAAAGISTRRSLPRGCPPERVFQLGGKTRGLGSPPLSAVVPCCRHLNLLGLMGMIVFALPLRVIMGLNEIMYVKVLCKWG